MNLHHIYHRRRGAEKCSKSPGRGRRTVPLTLISDVKLDCGDEEEAAALSFDGTALDPVLSRGDDEAASWLLLIRLLLLFKLLAVAFIRRVIILLAALVLLFVSRYSSLMCGSWKTSEGGEEIERKRRKI